MKIEGELKLIVKDALKVLVKEKGVKLYELPDPVIEQPKFEEHGHYSTNVALTQASSLKMKPREIAEAIKAYLDERKGIIEKISIAGPGFINFFLKRARYIDLLDDVCKAGSKYGQLNIGAGKKVQMEFVSANPTGPLHVGHGRGAIYGDALASVLKAAGFSVSKEYYLNDAGNQIATLGRSVYLRIKEEEGDRTIPFPKECYQGHYIVEIARDLIASTEYKKLKKLSEEDAMAWCGTHAGNLILDEIKTDMADCGITFDTYFSEKTLHESKKVEETIEKLRKNGYAYDHDGAIWFKSSAFKDEKDRVLKKSTGEYTYFAADIAYHLNKFDRGFDRLIDIWGADHGGHVIRMKGAMEALGKDPNALDLVLIQLVNLVRGGEMVSMSTRSGTYDTLNELVRDVGKDVCRYFFLMRSHNAGLDFDLELARKHSPENPVYYIQYAHARICSVFKKAQKEHIDFRPEEINLDLLDLEEESRLARFLGEYPAVIRDSALNLEPHKVSFYLLELARIFQSYYSKAKQDERYKVLIGSNERIQTKLYLLKNIQIVLKNGLDLLGIEAPLAMLREESDAGL